MPKRVLVVDDDPSQRHTLEETIKRLGYHVATADSGERALAALKADSAGDISLVLLDLFMPDGTACRALGHARPFRASPPSSCKPLRPHRRRHLAAMRAGAVDFVVKPVSPERLEVSIKNALKIEALADELVRIKASAKGELGFADLIAGSEAMTRVLELGKRAANSAIPVLIEGESGVGKELIARAIQGESAREIGAVRHRQLRRDPRELRREHPVRPREGLSPARGEAHGKFVEADTGTLFLDEIGELPLEAQVKLLARAARRRDRSGRREAQERKVDFRLIAATNRNLIDLVNDGRFREDLFYRLNVFPIWVPPLRDAARGRARAGPPFHRALRRRGRQAHRRHRR